MEGRGGGRTVLAAGRGPRFAKAGARGVGKPPAGPATASRGGGKLGVRGGSVAKRGRGGKVSRGGAAGGSGAGAGAVEGERPYCLVILRFLSTPSFATVLQRWKNRSQAYLAVAGSPKTVSA